MTASPLNPQGLFEQRQMLMDVVDTLRHAQVDTDQLLGEAEREEALIAQTQALYTSQGLAVDEALIRQGLQALKEKRYGFTAPRPGLALNLARLYVSRGQWGPRWVKRLAATTTMVALLGLGVWAVGLMRLNAWDSRAVASLGYEQNLRASYPPLVAQVRAIPRQPQPLADAAKSAQGALDEGSALLAGLPRVPTLAADREAFYRRDPAQARALVARRDSRMQDVFGRISSARSQLDLVRQTQDLYRSGAVFDGAVAAHLGGLRDRLRGVFHTAAARGDVKGMKAAVASFGQALEVESVRAATANKVALMQGVHAQKLAAQLTQAEAQLSAGEVAGAQATLAQVESVMAVLPLTYTLRVVNEKGERSGVWRNYHGEGGGSQARSFYIIVDALDEKGDRVNLPIVSAEDKKKRFLSRFGVRVPEKVFETIANDKKDDGIVDNDVFGRKAAGELDPTYSFDTLNGMIAEW